MKLRLPLYSQIVALLFLQLTLIVVLVLIAFSAKFSRSWETILQTPVGDRIQGIALDIQREIQSNPQASVDGILERFGKLYGVRFYLFDTTGTEVAGEKIRFPEELLSQCKVQVPNFSAFPRLSTKDFKGFLDSPPTATPLNFGGAPPFFAGRIFGSKGPPLRRFLLHTEHPDAFWIGTRGPIYKASDKSVVLGSLVASTDSLWQTRIFFDFGPSIAVAGGMLFFSILFWSPYAHHIASSLKRLTAVTEKIAEGRFDSRVKTNEWDELGSLGASINRMAERLNNFVAGEKRFLGDIAHELCSPMARLQIALELLEGTGTPEQERTLIDIREEVEEMTNLINELLAFSKAGLKGKDLELVPINLADLLADVTLRTGSEKLVTVKVDKEIYVLGDEMLLARAFANVIRNAVRYASTDGPIDINVDRTGDLVTISTSDSGPGVPPAVVSRLGEPFFRPDTSRTRASGGTGLGLAIVKSCTQSCNGEFSVRNRDPKGLEVLIKLQACAQLQTPNDPVMEGNEHGC